MKDVQEAIKSYVVAGKTRYVFKCNGCGKELDYYTRKRIAGHVWCNVCLSSRQQAYLAKYSKTVFDEGKKEAYREIEEEMYHQCFEVDNDEDMQKWENGNWFRYKLFENVMQRVKEKLG